MKRPLLVITVVLVFGVYWLNRHQAELSFFKAVQPVSSAYGLTEEDNRKETIIEGTVVFIKPREDGWEYHVRTGKRALVRVISTESSRPLLFETVRVQGELYLFDRASNPGEFDVRTYYISLNILAGMKETYLEEVKGPPLIFPEKLFQLKLKLYSVTERLAAEEDRGVFETLLANIRDQLDPDVKEAYSKFGFISLISFSGIHITLYAGFIYRILRKKAGKKTALILTDVLLVIFYLFSGFSQAVFRACLVFSLRALAPVFKRKFDYLNAVSLSFILLLTEYPRILYFSTFQYLLASAFGLGILREAVRRAANVKSRFFQGVVFLFSLQAALLPVKLFSNFSFSPYALLTFGFSALCLPFIGASAVLGAFSGLLSTVAAAFFFGTGHFFLLLIRKMTDVLACFPFQEVITGCPDIKRIMIYYLMSLIPVLFINLKIEWEKHQPEEIKKENHTAAVLICLIPAVLWLWGVFFLRAPQLKEGELKVTALDVGQGDCTVIRTRNHTIIYDCGSSSSPDVGKDILVPYLKYEGVQETDLLLMSHGDADHTNGVEALLDSYPPDQVILPGHKNAAEEFQDIIGAASERNISLIFLSAGDSVENEDLSLHILWPWKNAEVSGNEGSLVTLVEKEGFSGLLTGDISSEEEELIPVNKPVTWLKTAHHGSKYSTSDEFLHRARPVYATISAGRRNPYGHPAEETLKRLSACGSIIYTTARSGAIELVTYENNTDIKTFLALDGP